MDQHNKAHGLQRIAKSKHYWIIFTVPIVPTLLMGLFGGGYCSPVELMLAAYFYTMFASGFAIALYERQKHRQGAAEIELQRLFKETHTSV